MRMYRKLRLPSPAMAVGLAALFVALSGTAVAAGVPALAKRALVADNAKKLGGKTSAQLLSTANAAAKASATAAATAAAQQPGPASTAVGLITVKAAPYNIGANGEGDFTASCDAGQKAVGGGYDNPSGLAFSLDTRPGPDGASWKVYLVGGPSGGSGSIFAVCMK
jgi:hypothetical protein